MKFPYTCNGVARLQGSLFSRQTFGGKLPLEKILNSKTFCLEKSYKYIHLVVVFLVNNFRFDSNLQMFLRNRWQISMFGIPFVKWNAVSND